MAINNEKERLPDNNCALLRVKSVLEGNAIAVFTGDEFGLLVDHYCDDDSEEAAKFFGEVATICNPFSKGALWAYLNTDENRRTMLLELARMIVDERLMPAAFDINV